MITYNNKDILKSFIGNNRIVKKYLNNKVVYGTPDFAQYYLIDHKDNYDIVGDTIIQNNIANNFSAGENGNHLIIDNFSNIWTFSTLELNVKFRFTNVDDLGVGSDHLLGTSILTPFNRLGMSASKTSNSKINIMSMVYLVNPDTGNYFSVTGNQFPYLDENVWYVYNLTTDGTNMVLSLYSEDGTLLGQKSNTFGTPTNKCYSFDIIGNTNVDINGVDWAGYFHGDIDLSETYIKVNDRYMFNGNQNYKELLDCNPNVYLQSDGLGQYIQTNIQATGDTEVSTSFSVAQIETLSSIFSSRTSYSIANFGLSSREQGILTAYYNNSNRDIPNFIVQPNRRTYIDMIKNNISVDNINYGAIANYASFTASIPLRFFALATSTPSYFLNGKLYRTNIVNGNDKYDFVPVPEGLQIGSYKIPSNGMFDIVTQTFYENKGSGEFIWGVDL